MQLVGGTRALATTGVTGSPATRLAPLTSLLTLTCLLLFLVAAAQATPGANRTDLAGASQQYYRAGMVLVEQNHLDEAIAVFQQGLTTDEGNTILLDAVGAAYSLEGNLREANKYFLHSLQASPQFMPARKNLAINYFTLGEYDLAQAELTRLKGVAGAPSATVTLLEGMIAEKKGDYAAGLSLIDQAAQVAYTNPEALLSLANAAVHTQHMHRAISALRAMEGLSGISAAQYMRAGQLYQAGGDNAKALECLDRADAIDQTLPGLAYRRATLLDQMNRSREAMTILKDLAVNRPDSRSLNLLAHVAEKNREFALAMDSLRQAAKLDPDREENYLDFSTICADYGNYSLALQAAEIGLEHIPDSYKLQVQKGVVLENLGRPEEAETILTNAIQLQQDNSVAVLSLAIVQTHAGELVPAESTLRAAIQNFPTNYYMHYQLGKVLVRLQEATNHDPTLAARTRQAFQSAIRFNPSFADSYYQLAKLTVKETPAAAERNLVTCLRLNPEHAPAEYMLARLYLSSGRRSAGQVLIDRFEKLQQAAKLKEQQEPKITTAQN